MAEPGPTITVPVRLAVGDTVHELGVLTLAMDTVQLLGGADQPRCLIGGVRAPERLAAELAALLDHAARTLRKGAPDAVAPAQ